MGLFVAAESGNLSIEMRRLRQILASVALAAWLAGCGGGGGGGGPTTGGVTAPPTPVASGAPQSAEFADVESRIMDGVNVERQRNGLAPVSGNDVLHDVARTYSRRMAEESFFSHDSPSGDSVQDRVEERGLRYRAVGENLFQAVHVPVGDLPRVAVEGWMNSPGHRGNILGAYEQTGVGVWQVGNSTYVTQVFFTPY